MLYFASDYMEGAHERIYEAMEAANKEHLPGYGTDPHCAAAAEKIRAACGCPEADVYFIAGGTQTNQVVIDTMLAPYEGVIAAESGHVNQHEAGAIEYTGHKVLALPAPEGKLQAGTVKQYIERFYQDQNHEHMVFPGMVYISHPTEFGTLYTKDELAALSAVCREYEIPLFLDGARLGYGLACPEADLDLMKIAELTDVFYIGGTKVGALFGEAVVFPHGGMPKYFATRVKQHGAMLAKGWLLGIQFETLFTDDLYLLLGENGIRTARKIREALRRLGFTFYMESPTNQILIILDQETYEKLQEKAVVSYWEPYDDHHTVVRICTGWATEDADVDELIRVLEEL